MKVALPFLEIKTEPTEFSSVKLRETIRAGLELAAKRPCYIEVADASQQCLLFLRSGLIYSAGRIEDGQFDDISIKEFFLTSGRLESASITCCEVDSKILHSLLILFQKKPMLQVLTSMVDLDEVLDKIEEEKKSCVVSAVQDEFVAMLRYEMGSVTALCYEKSLVGPHESNLRDDFLLKIYTMSAATPLEIKIYDNLLVTYASDAKMIDARYQGDIANLYLSKPPMITLEFKGTEIGHWVMDKPALDVGRTADNHIQIDNLAVSRLHAVIEKDVGDYYIKDCDSLNGTLLNGKRIGRAKLGDGDQITIGKHTLLFQNSAGKARKASPDIAPFDQTIIMQPDQAPPEATVVHRVDQASPRLIERTDFGETIIELNKPAIVIGKDADADISIGGFLVAKHHAEIVNKDGDYIIRHVSGYRKVSVGGEAIKERVLKNNDEIRIGKKEFIFQE